MTCHFLVLCPRNTRKLILVLLSFSTCGPWAPVQAAENGAFRSFLQLLLPSGENLQLRHNAYVGDSSWETTPQPKVRFLPAAHLYVGLDGLESRQPSHFPHHHSWALDLASFEMRVRPPVGVSVKSSTRSVVGLFQPLIQRVNMRLNQHHMLCY